MKSTEAWEGQSTLLSVDIESVQIRRVAQTLPANQTVRSLFLKGKTDSFGMFSDGALATTNGIRRISHAG